FDAKSLKRADSRIVPTRNRAQSGLLIVFKDLDANKMADIYQAAQVEEGSRSMTCVNANCRVLASAGFTSGGVALNDFYMPTALFHHILQYGLEVDNKPIDFDVVRTSPDYLENFGFQIDKSVGLTPCRHFERSCNEKTTNKNVYLFNLRNRLRGQKWFGIFYSPSAKTSPSVVTSNQLINLPENAEYTANIDLRVSQPSHLGRLLRLLWGPHSLFEMKTDSVDINDYLPEKLKAYAQKQDDFVTRIKKNLLFSKSVISYIRSHLSNSYSDHPSQTEKDLFDMMRVHTSESPHKYNIVATGKKIVVLKLNIANKIVDWILSKHILIDNYSQDVRFAGEIWKNEMGQLVVSRNSGTFKPSQEQLKAFVDYLDQVLPHVNIIADEF
ncbi:MAG: hypothetical protein KDD40_06920, partial [Bdellovibrionales bacterium]|nr:hypothetical protein [Bdellovibrionales bacterium]